MQVNRFSPNFTGFIRIHNSKDDTYTSPINTANILSFNSSVYPDDKLAVNHIAYLDHKNELKELANVFSLKDDEFDPELPYGEDFNRAVSFTCTEADKTGDILSILV